MALGGYSVRKQPRAVPLPMEEHLMIDDPAALQDLMRQVGPTLDLARVTAYEGNQAWRLVFDDEHGSVIDAEWDSHAGRVVFTAEVATVPETARASAFELLLTYNYLWSAHGGVRAAVTGPAGDVVLLFDLALEGLDLPRLCEVLGNMHAIARSCRAVLEALADSAGAPETAHVGGHAASAARGSDSAFSPLMIRV